MIHLFHRNMNGLEMAEGNNIRCGGVHLAPRHRIKKHCMFLYSEADRVRAVAKNINCSSNRIETGHITHPTGILNIIGVRGPRASKIYISACARLVARVTGSKDDIKVVMASTYYCTIQHRYA